MSMLMRRKERKVKIKRKQGYKIELKKRKREDKMESVVKQRDKKGNNREMNQY